MPLHSRRSIVIKLSIILALVTGVVLANSAGPQLGLTGGFGENTCVQCHSSFQVNSGGGSVSISGLPPNGYTPDTEYSLAVTVSKSGQLRWGFELAARFQDGGNQAGSLIAGNGTQIRTGGPQNVQYISHNAPGTWAGTQDSGAWSFK